ncbi:Juvenile hormone epoxide hydrolase [Papilio machaon]|uniref:Juvenile hormone epoxide hydrolase n=1 Tax=Papilio machaon TaxID=76193 RepID=A0A0N0PFF8_PAPMA|nr:Juvenile hormone epoxide hydrolase [Papilio machaon]
MSKLLTIVAAVVTVVIAWILLSPSPKPPVFDPEEWWGPMEMKGKQDTSIRPFTIKFDDAVHDQRLKATLKGTPSINTASRRYRL